MHNIRATRVSLVKNPANRLKFLVTKAEEFNTMDDIIKIITDSEADDESTLVEALKAQGKDDNAVDAALAVYRVLNGFRDSLDESDLGVITKSLGYKAPEGEKKPDGDKVKPAAGIAKAEGESVENGEGTDEIKAVNDVLKSLRDEVDVLKSDKTRAQFTETLADVNVGKTTEELVDMLMTIDKAGGDVKVMIETLKTASNIAKQNLFEEIGSDGTGDAGDAWTAMKSAADVIAKEEKVSPEVALASLHKTHPELVQAYQDEV